MRAGVNEKLAMEILGHKPPSIFKRYNITPEDDKRDALGAVAANTRAKQGQTVGSGHAARGGENA